jgi:hypothetical protein
VAFGRAAILLTVSDGREGLVTAANGGYEVLVVDRMLPGLDGAQRRPSGNENDVAREGLGTKFVETHIGSASKLALVIKRSLIHTICGASYVLRSPL